MPAQPNVMASKITAQRLIEFARRCYTHKRLKAERKFYVLAQRETAGPWFGDEMPTQVRAWDELRPVSSLGHAMRTYLPHLMGERIDPVVEPGPVGGRGEAKILEMRRRQWVDDTGYLAEDEAGVMDSLLDMGIWYVGRRAGGQGVSLGGSTIDMGAPFVQRLDRHRLVYDPRCDNFDMASLMGHRYDADRQAMLDAGVGDEAVIRQIPNVWEDSAKDDSGRGESSEDGQSPIGSEEDYLDDRIPLWDLCYMEGGRRMRCTVGPLNGGAGFVVKPTEIVDEPEGWPYVICALDRMPGRMTPVSPARAMMDYHLSRDRVVAKLVNEIEEIGRDYIAAKGEGQKLAMKLTTPSPDGRSRVLIGDPKTLTEYVRGGMTDPAVAAFGLLTKLGEETGPNVDVLAGQDGQASESATSTSIRAGNGAIVMGRWKSVVNNARASIMRRVSAMLLQSGDRRVLEAQTPGGPVQLIWDALELQDLSYDQFKYDIKLSSASQGMDQRTKLRSIVELFTQAVPAVVQTAAQLGVAPTKALRVLSDLSGFAEIDEMLPTGDGEQIRQQALAWMVQQGKARPVGIAQPQMPAQAPAAPQTRVGQMNSDRGMAVPS